VLDVCSEPLCAEAAAFVEVLVDHMVPADELSPQGTDLGIHRFIERALASRWAWGDRTYLEGPWRQGTASQGYQGRWMPIELVRTGIRRTNAHCRQEYGKAFHEVSETQREEVLQALSRGEVEFEDDGAGKDFFDLVYSLVMEGMFSDPIYGGNRAKAAWRMLGFPGVSAGYRRHLALYRDRPFHREPVSIEDLG
jgi:gluconate 2-dehydrogenase gamma chain